jgi:hypothetical protein
MTMAIDEAWLAWLAEEWTYLAEKESGGPWRELSSGIVTNMILRTLKYLGYEVVPAAHIDGSDAVVTDWNIPNTTADEAAHIDGGGADG